MNALEAKIIRILADHFDIEESLIQLHTKFEDLSVNTIDLVDVIVAIEDELNMIIPEDAHQKINTVQNLVSYFRRAI